MRWLSEPVRGVLGRLVELFLQAIAFEPHRASSCLLGSGDRVWLTTRFLNANPPSVSCINSNMDSKPTLLIVYAYLAILFVSAVLFQVAPYTGQIAQWIVYAFATLLLVEIAGDLLNRVMRLRSGE